MNMLETLKLTLNEVWYKHLRTIAAAANLVAAEVFFALKLKALAFHFSSSSLRYKLSTKGAHIAKSLAQSTSLDSFTTKNITAKGAAQRSIILKWPDFNQEKIEKGILLVTFTGTFSFFISKVDSLTLEKYFIIVLEPSWSGYADADILGFCKLKNKIIIECPEIQDRALMNQFQENFIAASFGASDWVNHKEFKPTHTNKIYDSIYIANANPIKRVLRYAKAIRNIVAAGHPNFKACLVCAEWGGSKTSIENIIKKYNLGENLTLKYSLNKTEVIEHLNLSKTNILLSYKEGSNRSLFESMFCNIPVICIYENIGVNKSYINEHTGMLVQDGYIEEALIWLSKNYTRYSPREWALENISPEVTSQKLYSIIKNSIEENILPTKPIMVKTNNPEVQYMDWPALEFYDINEELFQIFAKVRQDQPYIIKEIAELTEKFNTRLACHDQAFSR